MSKVPFSTTVIVPSSSFTVNSKSPEDPSAQSFAQGSEVFADVGQLIAQLLKNLHHLGGLGDLAALGKQLLVGALESETAASDEEMYLF